MNHRKSFRTLTQVTAVKSNSHSSDEEQLELDTASDDEEPNDDMFATSVEEGKLDTTTSMPSSKYFDEYEFNQQHPDSIHKKSNVTEKMSKNISDKVTAAESLSSMSSTAHHWKTAGKWQKCNLVSGMASVASNMGWL